MHARGGKALRLPRAMNFGWQCTARIQVLRNMQAFNKNMEIPKKQTSRRTADDSESVSVVIVLIIYNNGSSRSASFLNHSLRATLFLASWTLQKNLSIVNDFLLLHYKLSSHEISFHFCHTSCAKRLHAELSFCGCGAVRFFCFWTLIYQLRNQRTETFFRF